MLTRVNQLGLKAALRAKEDEDGVKRKGKGKGKGRGKKKSKSSQKLKLLKKSSKLNLDKGPNNKKQDIKKPKDDHADVDMEPKTKPTAKAKAAAKAKAKASAKPKANASAKAKAKISKVDKVGTGGGSNGPNKRSKKNPPENDEVSPEKSISSASVQKHIEFLLGFVKNFKADNMADLKVEVKQSLEKDADIHESCQFVNYWTRPACNLTVYFTEIDKRSVSYYQINSNFGGSHEQRALLCVGLAILSVAWRFNLRKNKVFGFFRIDLLILLSSMLPCPLPVPFPVLKIEATYFRSLLENSPEVGVDDIDEMVAKIKEKSAEYKGYTG